MRKKIISPGHRKAAARAVVASGLCSGRAACRFLELSRATFWYRERPLTDREERLRQRMLSIE